MPPIKEILREIREFLWAVFWQWVSAVACGTITFTQIIYPKLTKSHSFPNGKEFPVSSWWILGACFLAALFLAWREQYRKALARIGLMGRVRYRAFFETDDGRVGIAVALQLTNTGEPTIVDGWGLTFALDGVAFGFPAVHFLDGKCDIPDNKGNIARITPEHMLYNMVSNNPIIKGGRKSGFLVFITKDISYARLIAKSPPVTVLYRDASGQEYTASEGSQGIAAPFHEPGLDDPFAPIVIAQAKSAIEGQKLYYSVVERIDKGTRPIMALLELGIADHLDTNDDVVNFCRQLVADKHGDPFEHLGVMYPPAVWREFLREARRKNLKFPDAESEVQHMAERLREHDAKVAKDAKE